MSSVHYRQAGIVTRSQTGTPIRQHLKILVMAIAFALFFAPKAYAIGHSAYTVWRIATISVSLIILVVFLAKGHITIRWSMFMLFLLAYYCLSTFLTPADGSRTQIIFYLAEVGGFITLSEYGLSTDKEACLKAFLIGGVAICTWHYATFLVYRNYSAGMNFGLSSTYGELARRPYFLLTHDNGSVFYYLPVLCALWFWASERNHSYWLPLIASALTLYMYWSLFTVTAMVVTTFSVTAFIIITIFRMSRLRALLNYRWALFIGVAFCVCVIMFTSSDLLVTIANYFGKDNDLGRGRIWNRAIPCILEAPIIGNGFESDMTTINKLGINHCHNILMQVLYTGGLAAIIPFAIGLTQCNLPANKRVSPISKGQAMICVTIICLFVASTFDWYLYMPIQFFPFILYSFSSPSLDESSGFKESSNAKQP